MNHIGILTVLILIGAASILLDWRFPGFVPSPPEWLVAWAGWMFTALAVLSLTTNIRKFAQALQKSEPYPVGIALAIAVVAYLVDRFWFNVPAPAPWLLAWAGWTAATLAILRPQKLGELIQALASSNSVKKPPAGPSSTTEG